MGLQTGEKWEMENRFMCAGNGMENGVTKMGEHWFAMALACRRDAALRRVSRHDCPDLLWFACCAREVEIERHAHSDLSRRASLCMCVFC